MQRWPRVHPEFLFFFFPARQVLRTRREKRGERASLVKSLFFAVKDDSLFPPKKLVFSFSFSFFPSGHSSLKKRVSISVRQKTPAIVYRSLLLLFSPRLFSFPFFVRVVGAVCLLFSCLSRFSKNRLDTKQGQSARL